MMTMVIITPEEAAQTQFSNTVVSLWIYIPLAGLNSSEVTMVIIPPPA